MRTITDRETSLLRKVGWFVGLWLGGVLTVGGVAMVLRLALHAH